MRGRLEKNKYYESLKKQAEKLTGAESFPHAFTGDMIPMPDPTLHNWTKCMFKKRLVVYNRNVKQEDQEEKKIEKAPLCMLDPADANQCDSCQ